MGEGELEFYHESFLEGRKDLMRHITRGVPSQKRGAPGDNMAYGDPMHAQQMAVQQQQQQSRSDAASLSAEMRHVT